MIRQVIADQEQAAKLGPGHEVDTFLDRVVKYTPIESLILWVAAKGVVESAAPSSKLTILWVCFVLGVILTVVLAAMQLEKRGKTLAVRQTAIMKFAFIIWTIALGEPFTSLLGKTYQSFLGSLLLISYTVVMSALIKDPDPPVETLISRIREWRPSTD